MLWERRGPVPYSDVLSPVLASSGQTEEQLQSPPSYAAERIVGVPEAARAIFKARDLRQQAVIIGDYDTDGITSTAILSKLLTFLHIQHKTIIPRRMSEGYGVSVLHLLGVQNSLVITVDNGISAGQVLDEAKLDQGNTVVVIDHHLPGDAVPKHADAIIDPHLTSECGGFVDYCGAGLAYKLATYMLRGVKVPQKLANDLLLMAGIGTVADNMPLIGDNRWIVQNALEIANNPFSALSSGLSWLLENCRGQGPVLANTISYKVAPLLNAPGRMYDAGGTSALKVLLCDDDEQSRSYISKMVAINQERRKTVEFHIEEANKIASEQSSPIVVYIPSLQEGLLGVIAGRLLDAYATTSIVLSNSRQIGVVKGSVRAAAGSHAREMLDSVKPLLISYGGHEGAAGLTIGVENIEEFTESVKLYDRGVVPTHRLLYDVEISYSEVVSSMAVLKRLEPLGKGVENPVCFVRDIPVSEVYYLGSDKTTVKLVSEGFAVLGFGKADLYRKYGEPQRIDAIGCISENHFGGNTTVQLVFEDLRPCVF